MNEYMRKMFAVPLAVLAMAFAACEKGYDADYDGEGEVEEEGSIKVTFNVVSVDQVSFGDTTYSTRATGIGELCTRIDFAAFSESDVKTSVNQTSDDDDFGTLSVSLTEGTYQIVIIAHSGTGSATISSADEIKFSNNKVTDTFYYYAELDVTESGSYDITLTRAVAMFRLIVTDSTPEDVTQMEFYYTGGSSTFDATTGFGCVQSRQTEDRDVESSAYEGESVYEVYTFPHETDDVLKMTVTALDASGDDYLERVFTDVPVTVNTITQYTGVFFEQGEEQSATFALTTDSEWSTEDYTY